MSIRYCVRCVYPDTKPDLKFHEDGVCSACRNYENRKEIDYIQRKADLAQILARHARPGGYDCLIPVSGGKDSTFQVLTVLELGHTPLCVTASTDKLTAIGRRNLENLKGLGVDLVEVSVNPVVRRLINRHALVTVGDISWPEHVLIFTVPVRMAVAMDIPLIIWGENSQHEYGGPASAAESRTLTRRWLEEFGGMLGMRVSDLEAPPKDVIQYTYPTDKEMCRSGVTGLFLGYYVPWDGYHNALIAQAHGFETYPHAVEGSLVNYENLDNAQTGIHDFFKWLKYGFGRATDLASMAIRRGRLRRDEAKRLVKLRDGRYPSSYLGCGLQEILGEIGMSEGKFLEVCRRFTSEKLFKDPKNTKHLERVNDDNGDVRD